MNRPYYVHTPRNGYGEPLEFCPLTIRTVHKSREDIRAVVAPGPKLDSYKAQSPAAYRKAKRLCDEFNDQHETMLAFAAGI